MRARGGFSGVARVGIWVVVGLALSLLAAQADATIPKKIAYQGRLTDSAGDPLAGSHTVFFSLHNTESGGIMLWSETQSVTADSNGVFSAILGSTTPIQISFADPKWLEITVDAQLVSPRREIVSVASAFNAQNADSLGGLAPGSYAPASHTHYALVAADGDPVNALYVDADGEVGIGTPNPARVLHIRQEVNDLVAVEIDNQATGSASAEALIFRDENGELAGIQTYDDSSPTPNGMTVYNNRPGGHIRLNTGSTERMRITDGGAIGIGTPIPGALLHLRGSQSPLLMLDSSFPDQSELSFASDGVRKWTWYVPSAGGNLSLRHAASPVRDQMTFLGSSGGIDLAPSDGYVRVAGSGSSAVKLSVEGSRGIAGALRATNTSATGTGAEFVGNGEEVWMISSGCGAAAAGSMIGFFAHADTVGNHGQAGVYATIERGPAYAYLCYRSAAGTQYKVIGTGAASTVMTTSEGPVSLICPESPEAWIEDYGSGEMVTGSCHVELDPQFLECVTVDAAHPLRVFVQLTSPLEQQYYVKKGETGFDVVAAGASSGQAWATFDYKVVGKWKGFEKVRFERMESRPEAVRMSRAEGRADG